MTQTSRTNPKVEETENAEKRDIGQQAYGPARQVRQAGNCFWYELYNKWFCVPFY